MAKTKPFVKVDRAVAWVLAALLALMALPLLIGPLLPEPEGASRDGFGPVALFWGIAFAYGAAAVLQRTPFLQTVAPRMDSGFRHYMAWWLDPWHCNHA